MSHQTSDQNLEDSSTPPRGGPDHRPRHDEGVGDRLGQARDQRPDLTTAASPAPSSVAEGGVALNRVFQTPGPYRQGPNLQPQAQGTFLTSPSASNLHQYR